MTLYLTTTGNQSPVILDDLAGIEIVHQTTNLDLGLQFTDEEINNSQDLKDALANGYITLTDENGKSINEIPENNAMQKTIYDTDNDNLVDDSNKLEGSPKADILNRANHTGTQTVSTISDFTEGVNSNRTVVDNKTHRETINANPHGVTKDMIDLGNVDNTADADKPISTAQQTAFDTIDDKFENGLLEPTGIPKSELENSTLEKDDANRKCKINVSADTFYYIHGVKYELPTGIYEATITDTSGMWFFYFDGGTTLKATNTPTTGLFQNNALVIIATWSVSQQEFIIFEDERHGTIMDGTTHYRLHETIGAVVDKGTCATNIYTATGDGSSDNDVNVGFTAGKVWDEDRDFDINTRIGLTDDITVFYLKDGEWKSFTDTTNHFPIIYGTSGCSDYVGHTRIAYNDVSTPGSETLSEVTQGDFVVYLNFAMNENDETKRIATIIGQRIYTTLSKAKAGIITELQNLFTNGLPSNEFAFISGYILQTKSSYSNIVKARIREVESGVSHIDLRGSTKSSVSASNGNSIINSNELSVRTITSDDTIVDSDDVIIVDNSANAIILTLPTISTSFKKKRYTILIKSKSFPLTIKNSSQTAPKQYVMPNNNFSITIFPIEGDDWEIISDNSNEDFSQDVLDGLFLYNKFETLSSNIFPSDVGENLQAINGATIDVNGKIGNCALFDGTNDYLQASHNSSQVNADVYDFIFWVKTSATGVTGGLIHKAGAYENINFTAYSDAPNGYISIYWVNSNGDTIDLNTGWHSVNIVDNSWHMIEIIGTADGTNITTEVFVDNVKINTLDPAQPQTSAYKFKTDSTSPVLIGLNGLSDYFNGKIDILRMYNRRLTDDERNAIWNAGAGSQG